MIKHLSLSIFVLILSVLTLSSCKKKNEESAEQTLTFKFKAETSLSSATVTAIPSINWNYALLNLDNFDVKLKQNGTVVGGNAMAGLWNVNMLADNNDLLTITFRTYNKFDEVDGILNLKPSAEHPPLTLKALVTLPTGAVVPVEFYFNDEASLHIDVKNMSKVTRSNYIVVVKFEVNKLFAALDLSKLPTATRTGNKIIIGSTSNVELYNLAKMALNNSYTVTLE